MKGPWLSAEDAADFLGLSLSTFSQRVRDGVIPAPSLALGPRTQRWYINQLDDFMHGRKPAPAPPDGAVAYAERLEAEGRQKRAQRDAARKRIRGLP